MIEPGSPVYGAALSALASASANVDPSAQQDATHDIDLHPFSLVFIFNARDSVSGIEFEVRKWWRLTNTFWHCSFEPMLVAPNSDSDARTRSNSFTLQYADFPLEDVDTHPVMDITRLSEISLCESL